MSDKEMFEALHPDPGKHGTRVTKAHYDVYRDALLKVIPANEEGIPFKGLADLVATQVPADIAAKTSPGWWTTTVKLDLEARKLIERIPGAKPQRIRRL